MSMFDLVQNWDDGVVAVDVGSVLLLQLLLLTGGHVGEELFLRLREGHDGERVGDRWQRFVEPHNGCWTVDWQRMM